MDKAMSKSTREVSKVAPKLDPSRVAEACQDYAVGVRFAKWLKDNGQLPNNTDVEDLGYWFALSYFTDTTANGKRAGEALAEILGAPSKFARVSVPTDKV